jgi:hypothetical protein
MAGYFVVLIASVIFQTLLSSKDGMGVYSAGEPAIAEYLKLSGADHPRPPILLLPGLVSSRLVVSGV